MVTNLNVEFNPNAVKMINEICKCNPLQGVADGLGMIESSQNQTINGKYQKA